MSKRQPARPKKKQPRPIVLPQAFPGAQMPSDTLLTGTQTKQIQDLIDLLRRNNLTELELERQGVRIRVRHEVGMKAVTASVQDAAPAAAQTGSQPAAASGTPSPPASMPERVAQALRPLHVAAIARVVGHVQDLLVENLLV